MPLTTKSKAFPFIIILMSDSEFMPNEQPRSQYTQLPLSVRRQLVEKVVKGSSILSAARDLQIKPSTAKRIVKRFKVQGTFYESKKMKRLRRQEKAKEYKSIEGTLVESPEPQQVKEEGPVVWERPQGLPKASVGYAWQAHSLPQITYYPPIAYYMIPYNYF